MVPEGALMAFSFVAIGASLGGTDALQVLLPALPGDFPAALALVLHRGRDSDESLIDFLQRNCRLPVGEAQDKTLITPGHVYVAPADYHLLVEGNHFALSTEAAVAYARPSIDVLFESAAEAWGKAAIGVILTGTGQDGAQGLAAIKRYGGLTVVQAPATAERSDMPNGALATGMVDEILPLDEIAPFLARRCSSI